LNTGKTCTGGAGCNGGLQDEMGNDLAFVPAG